MLSTANVITFFASYDVLNSIVSTRETSHINFFIDLKNVVQSLYRKDAIEIITENTKQFNSLDLSLFHSIFNFLSYYKVYCIKKGLTCNFYFFFETGDSTYHQTLYKKYKSNRKIDKLFGFDTETKELFYLVFQKNLGLIEKIGNKLPNVKVIKLDLFEADFIPYYLINYKNIGNDDNDVNIILSNDHDMWQCANDNTFIYSRYGKRSKVISKGKVLNNLFKDSDKIYNDDYYTLILSIIGDKSDNIEGIKGIGEKRADIIYDELARFYPDPSIFLSKIKENIPLFDDYNGDNKYMIIVRNQENEFRTVTRNMQLISFEIISRLINDPTKLYLLEVHKKIESVLENNSYIKFENLVEALKRSQIYVDEDIFGSLYYANNIRTNK
ncbi:MAG: hypothetical protein KatS3mg002_0443 [Candidatus Woesearchaeota archaeon]|nr:MAG: hypothetical protein KatS3mg002_0443 [Candidatus Woesearchaeota archaeon]